MKFHGWFDVEIKEQGIRSMMFMITLRISYVDSTRLVERFLFLEGHNLNEVRAKA